MRLPDGAHISQPWAIHALAPDFDLLDVWALPTPGEADDFAALIATFAGATLSGARSGAAELLFAIRVKLGSLLGWDGEPGPPGQAAPSLRGRLPPELRDAPSGPTVRGIPCRPIYLREREWAAEIVNRTGHGVVHLGWVRDVDGGYRGQLAVLVKPNGAFGRAYLAAIKPFRHLIVYPALLNGLGRAWRARVPA